MAAGLSLSDEQSVDLFRKRLNENCRLTDEDFEEILHIDVAMPLAYADLTFIHELSRLAPFGVGNPRPLFARKGISLLSGKKLGKGKKVGKYRIADENGRTYEMIYFGDGERLDGFLTERYGEKAVAELYGRGVTEGTILISMAYYPDINCFGGRETIQIIMQDYC